jgi:hypothetical protein
MVIDGKWLSARKTKNGMKRLLIVEVGASSPYLELPHVLILFIAANRCPPLSLIANATADMNNASMLRTITYTCDPGHLFENGNLDARVTCTSSLTWQGYDTNLVSGCKRMLHQKRKSNDWILHRLAAIDCLEIPRKHHAYPLTSSTVLGSLVEYRCEMGYKWPNISAPAMTACLTSGAWSEDQMIQDCQGGHPSP